MGVLLPSLDEPEGAPALGPVELSRELLEILDSAERRVSALGGHHPSSVPSPEEELDLLLPPDLLASLDEPIDPDDEESTSGASTGGTGYPKPKTMGESASTGTTTGAPLDAGLGLGVASGAAPPSREPEPTFATMAEPGSRLPNPSRVGVGPIPVEPPPDRLLPMAEDEGITTGALAVDPPAEGSRDGGSAPKPPAEGSRDGGSGSERPITMPAPPPTEERPEPSRAPVWSREAVEPPPEVAIAHDLHLRPRLSAEAPAPPPKARAPELRVPAVLGEGDAVRTLSAAIAARTSGSIALGGEGVMRRIVLHEGDIVTAASGAPDETLVAFLAARGDLERDVAARLASKLPGHGRHAGAALIAHGHLGQDDLWPVLRAHAEWIIGRALLCEEGTGAIEAEPPGRLKAEPNVFGGATGAEVLLEQIRRVVPPEVARRRLGGATARLAEGPHRPLLAECALRAEDEQLVRAAAGRSVGEVLADGEAELADVLYGLVTLGVLEVLAPTAPVEVAPPELDPLDQEALRQRVRARLALVEDGDYFALLGIAHSATAYEIRRAYLELRRAFEPGRVLTAATADLAGDVRLVAEVIDEAYEILREPHRRERYRRAIEAGPP
jgi:hypothetical protein